jgi:hypothetical protein
LALDGHFLVLKHILYDVAEGVLSIDETVIYAKIYSSGEIDVRILDLGDQTVMEVLLKEVLSGRGLLGLDC